MLKLKCVFIEPAFEKVLSTMFTVGATYRGISREGSKIKAIDIPCNSEGTLAAIPVGSGYDCVAGGMGVLVRFKPLEPGKLAAREVSIDRIDDPRRMRRFARQIMKRRKTNPVLFNKIVHDRVKRIARGHGK